MISKPKTKSSQNKITPASTASRFISGMLQIQKKAPMDSEAFYFSGEILLALNAPTLNESLERRNQLFEKGLSKRDWLNFAISVDNPSLLDGISEWPWSKLEKNVDTLSQFDCPAFHMALLGKQNWYSKAFETGLKSTDKVMSFNGLNGFEGRESKFSLLEIAIRYKLNNLVEILIQDPAVQKDKESWNRAFLDMVEYNLLSSKQALFLESFSPTLELDKKPSLKILLNATLSNLTSSFILNAIKTISVQDLDAIFNQESALKWIIDNPLKNNSDNLEKLLSLGAFWDKKRKWSYKKNRVQDFFEEILNSDDDFEHDFESILASPVFRKRIEAEPFISWSDWVQIIEKLFQEVLDSNMFGDALRNILNLDFSSHLEVSAQKNWKNVETFIKKLAQAEGNLDLDVWTEKVKLSMNVLKEASTHSVPKMPKLRL